MRKLLFLLFLYASFAASLARGGDAFDPSLLRNGDLIFQTSRSGQSHAIQIATRSPWSHCGIVYVKDGEHFVFEASNKVKLSPLRKFVRKGDGRMFEIKRLRSADSLLTPANLGRLKAEGKRFDGLPYDGFFGWGDDRIYCSELIYKMYRNALGVEIGVTRKLKDFDLSHPVVKATLFKRYGAAIPFEEVVIAPSDMHLDPKLVTIYSNFPASP
jgi:hypothetical protein